MELQIISLVFLIFAIVVGFIKKINVGLVALGVALPLSMIGKIEPKIIFSGFPSKLFLTLLGTMFFFSILQENKTLELLSKKVVLLTGKRTYLIPIIIYIISYLLSAAGPGAISVQSIMVILAVSLAIEMKISIILMGALSILGAVGGTTSPIALTGIIVADLTSNMEIPKVVDSVFLGVSLANFICAVVLYIFLKGYKIKIDVKTSDENLIFNKEQKISILSLLLLIITVVGFQYDVGLVSFLLALILILLKVGNEKTAIKKIPWGVLILISGVSVLMSVTKAMGGIDLLADILASMMNDTTASPIMGLTAGLMSWFSSANGVVFPTLIPTVTKIAADVGGNITATELIIAIVGGATVAGISPLSTGGSLILAAYSQETDSSEKEEQSLFAKLFITSFIVVVIITIFAFLGIFKIFS